MKKLSFLVVLLGLFVFFSLSAQAASNILVWDDPNLAATGITGYSLERKSEPCATTGTPIVFTEIAVIAAPTKTFTDANVIAGPTFCYRVAALRLAEKGPFSNMVDRTIPLPALLAPLLKPVVPGV